MSTRYRKRLSFWRFVLLTSGIGAGVGLLAGLILLEFDAGQIVMIAAATGFGAVVGLVMGIPAELVVRVAAPRLHSRTGAVLFCFSLGLVSVLAAMNILGMLIQGPVAYIEAYEWATLLFALGFAIPAGLLTACATRLIVLSAETSPPKTDPLTGLAC